MLIANGKTGYMSSVRNTTAPAAEWIAGGAVSYTHLDVYKRQAIKALFPNTYGMPLITFEAGEAVALPAIRFQNQRTHHRTQCQSHDRRNKHGYYNCCLLYTSSSR